MFKYLQLNLLNVTPFQLTLLLVFGGIVLVLIGFLVLMLSFLQRSSEESEVLSEKLRRAESQEAIDRVDRERRKREREVEGVVFIGPVPVVVRGYKIAIMFLVLSIVVFIVFLAIMFFWMMGLHI